MKKRERSQIDRILNYLSRRMKKEASFRAQTDFFDPFCKSYFISKKKLSYRLAVSLKKQFAADFFIPYTDERFPGYIGVQAVRYIQYPKPEGGYPPSWVYYRYEKSGTVYKAE